MKVPDYDKKVPEFEEKVPKFKEGFQNSRMFPKSDKKHLKRARGHIGRNVV